MIARVALLVLVVSTGVASAESIVALPKPPPPDPIVDEAAQANLESQSWRDNIVITLAVGGSFTLGFGVNDAVGRGGSGSLRLAKVATPRWLVTLEFGSYASLHSYLKKLHTNTTGLAMLGGQYYVRSKLWVRLAAGIGGYQGRMVALEGGGRGDQSLAGPAATVGGGLDLKRWGRFGIGLEIASTMIVTSDGVLSSNGMLLAAVID